jgi:hypothetical protein
MPQQGTPKRGEPRTEPEIIPANRRLEQPAGGESGIRVFVMGRGGRRTYFAKPGPLTALIAAIVLGALLVITFVFALGVFLIAILVVGVLVVALILSSVLSGYLRRLRYGRTRTPGHNR